MRSCPSCGAEVADLGGRACPRCGRTLSAPDGAEYADALPAGSVGESVALLAPASAGGRGEPAGATPSVVAEGAPGNLPASSLAGPDGSPSQPVCSHGVAPYPPYAPGYLPYPPYPLPVAPPRPPRRTGRLLAAIVAGVLLICALGACGMVWLSNLRLAPYDGVATETPSGTPTPTLTEHVMLRDDFSSATSGWANDGHCFYGYQGYHVAGSFICSAPVGSVKDVVMTADMKQIHGDTGSGYGLILRESGEGNYYAFLMTSDGGWWFDKWANGQRTTIVPFRRSGAIHTGLNAVNSLKVFAVGSHFELFANTRKLGQADDSTFTDGQYGLVASTDGQVEITVSTCTLAWLG